MKKKKIGNSWFDKTFLLWKCWIQHFHFLYTHNVNARYKKMLVLFAHMLYSLINTRFMASTIRSTQRCNNKIEIVTQKIVTQMTWFFLPGWHDLWLHIEERRYDSNIYKLNNIYLVLSVFIKAFYSTVVHKLLCWHWVAPLQCS